ncbi:hypothetical protein [Halovivax gelatinilyticus]|uniref:hypothetical protein n=1 Tax=Halovivax gelatinilyticus TaxID=2961597 RepID=UPI0020CA8527|nr:hypothetical protein [Halovivax gelatinilyticus]
MTSVDGLTHADMIRAEPVESAMYTIVPLGLALAQLGNSVINDLSFLLSVPFALVLVGYAVFLNQFNFARYRRERLERAIGP